MADDDNYFQSHLDGELAPEQLAKLAAFSTTFSIAYFGARPASRS